MYPVFPKTLFSIADLFAVRYLWVVFKEGKCCVGTQRAADIPVARLFLHGLFTFARTSACLTNSLAYLEYNIRYNIVTTVLYISEYVNHM